MGNQCMKNKAKLPKRKDIDELIEQEKLENEINDVPEQEEQVPEPVEEVEEVVEEEEEEEIIEEVVEDIKEEIEEPVVLEEDKSVNENISEDLDDTYSDIYTDSKKFNDTNDKLETGSQLTLSTDATVVVQEVMKLNEPAHEESFHNTYRSVTPCDMEKVDETAKIFSRRCGCDLGERHDENACYICRNIDLSDTPLLT
ncbi:glideosome-associated protein 45 [Hepatocystis sp. ex Piliocolobus tephrosceles]|nr:glideosome-associated protein 45 [Hepatocystis sp. ex Piliocolobus tephrosceles]